MEDCLYWLKVRNAKTPKWYDGACRSAYHIRKKGDFSPEILRSVSPWGFSYLGRTKSRKSLKGLHRVEN